MTFIYKYSLKNNIQYCRKYKDEMSKNTKIKQQEISFFKMYKKQAGHIKTRECFGLHSVIWKASQSA